MARPPKHKDGLIYCSRCETYKPPFDFSKSNARKDGLFPTCKECHNIWNRAFYARRPDLKYTWKKNKSDREKRRQGLLEEMFPQCAGLGALYIAGDGITVKIGWVGLAARICDRFASHKVRDGHGWKILGWYPASRAEETRLLYFFNQERLSEKHGRCETRYYTPRVREYIDKHCLPFPYDEVVIA